MAESFITLLSFLHRIIINSISKIPIISLSSITLVLLLNRFISNLISGSAILVISSGRIIISYSIYIISWASEYRTTDNLLSNISINNNSLSYNILSRYTALA